MLKQDLKKALCFYFITDDKAPSIEPLAQAKIAIKAGATIIQYRNKSFSSGYYREAEEIRDFCKCNGVPFIVNDNILLAKALNADGVHLGQDDESPAAARKILGTEAIIGISVSTLEELGRTSSFGLRLYRSRPGFCHQHQGRRKKDDRAFGPSIGCRKGFSAGCRYRRHNRKNGSVLFSPQGGGNCRNKLDLKGFRSVAGSTDDRLGLLLPGTFLITHSME